MTNIMRQEKRAIIIYNKINQKKIKKKICKYIQTLIKNN